MSLRARVVVAVVALAVAVLAVEVLDSSGPRIGLAVGLLVVGGALVWLGRDR
jgi:hypothetical protein